MISLFMGFISLFLGVVGSSLQVGFWLLIIICLAIANKGSKSNNEDFEIQQSKPPKETWGVDNEENIITVYPHKYKVIRFKDREVLYYVDDLAEAYKIKKCLTILNPNTVFFIQNNK